MAETDQDISFSILQEAIKQAKYNALKAVNSELVNLYWQIGAFVSKQLKNSSWGSKTVQQFSTFIKTREPAMKGFDRKNIYRMTQFYQSYQAFQIVAAARRQLQDIEDQAIVPAKLVKHTAEKITSATVWRQLKAENIEETALAKVNWTSHKILISRTQTEEERLFYLEMCLKENYSTRELERQISAGLFERIMLSKTELQHNIKNAEYSTCLIENFKDSYVFEFLDLPVPHQENDLKKGLINQMKNFILELGKDFLFIEEEYKLQVGNHNFYVDLLFYHRGLQCLIAFDLKKEKFEPEHLGKLNFYLEALDRDVKKENENPSIGILLCKDKDTEVVEYALNRSLSPTMVAQYKIQLADKQILQDKIRKLFM